MLHCLKRSNFKTYLEENISFSKIASFHLLGFTVNYIFLLLLFFLLKRSNKAFFDSLEQDWSLHFEIKSKIRISNTIVELY